MSMGDARVRRSTGDGQRRAAVALAAALGLVAGCAANDPAAAGELAVSFSALSAGGCQASKAGRNTIPESIATLAVALRVGDAAPRIERISRANLQKAGQWLLPDVKAEVPVIVDVWGCAADKTVGWVGRSQGLRVEAQKETSTQVFLAPTAALGCTGSEAKSTTAGDSDHLHSPRSAAAAAPLPGGDVAIVGGIGTWNGKDFKGIASRDVDVYDHRLGAFRAGPTLMAPRAFAHAVAVSATQVLVLGGVTSVQHIGDQQLPTPLLAPAKPADAVPAIAAELLDLEAGTSAAATLAVGAGGHLLSSMVLAFDGALIAGGVDAKGAVSAQATWIGDLATLATGGTGTSKALTMTRPRARPALVRLAGGGVLVVGGHADGAASGAFEWLKDVGAGFAAPQIVGDAALLASTALGTVGAAAASLGVRNGSEAVLVIGGVAYGSVSAEQSPTYLARVDAAGAKVTLTAVDLGGAALFGGFAGLGVAVTGGGLFSAGLVKLFGGTPCGAADAECIGSTLWRVALPAGGADTSPQPLTLVALESLGGPRLGVATAAVPGGLLLIGGQSAVVGAAGDGTAALDPTGRVLGLAPVDAALGPLCP